MKCQSCGKKEATVRYTEEINGKKQEMLFCVECAEKLGFVNFSNIFSPIFTNIPNFFDEIEPVEELKCSKCGYSFDDYTNTGVLGCPNCYDTFADRLDNIFLKLHGKNRHVSINKKNNTLDKTDNDKNVKNVESIETLKNKLKELVAKEEYEKAAIIRDKIKKIESRK